MIPSDLNIKNLRMQKLDDQYAELGLFWIDKLNLVLIK